MVWLMIGIGMLFGPAGAVFVVLVAFHFYIRWKFLDALVRIFQEKPLFIIPRGQSRDGAEDVRFPTTDGLSLRGCYLHGIGPRRGVILFGLEYGSNRWSCLPYCEKLLQAGYDVFAFEPRNQGESDKQDEYQPLQWVTDRDLEDTKAAIDYLRSRPDADPRGIGLFGISKGGSAGLLAAADEPYVLCCVTDGAYATHTTMVPYMRKWVSIYNNSRLLQGLLPMWYYGMVGRIGVRRVGKERGVRYLDLEKMMGKLAPRPLLMIHGGGDTYIKPEMAQGVFNHAREPKEFWLIPKAKHNQSLNIAGQEYHDRVCEFFEKHLASTDSRPQSSPLTATGLSEPVIDES